MSKKQQLKAIRDNCGDGADAATLAGADVNARDQNGLISLHAAVWAKNQQLVALLLGKGAEVNKANNDGATALYIASQNGDTEIVKLLFERGADINKANHAGSTPLFISLQQGHKNIVSFLLANGADVNQCLINSKASPLLTAVFNKRIEMVRWLLAERADVNAANKRGVTPLHVAAVNEHTEVVQLLLENGAVMTQKQFCRLSLGMKKLIGDFKIKKVQQLVGEIQDFIKEQKVAAKAAGNALEIMSIGCESPAKALEDQINLYHWLITLHRGDGVGETRSERRIKQLLSKAPVNRQSISLFDSPHSGNGHYDDFDPTFFIMEWRW